MHPTLRGIAGTLLFTGLAHAQLPPMPGTSSSFWMPRPQTGWAMSSYSWDDGISDNALGYVDGGDIVWLAQYRTTDNGLDADTITAVSTVVGSPANVGTIPPGHPLRVFVWEDTDDDNDPRTGLVCLAEEIVTVQDPYTDIKTTYPLSSPVQVEGNFFVGAGVNFSTLGTQFPEAIDDSEPGIDPITGLARMWVAARAGQNLPDIICDLNNQPGIFFNTGDSFGFPTLHLVEAESTGSGVVAYCTAKSGLVCGTPSIAFEGLPEAGASSGFEISAAPARGNRSGLIVYSNAGRAAIPFQGGTLCVNPAPLRRTTPVNSGGTAGLCDGVFRIDFNAFATGNLGGNPAAFLLNPGEPITAQYWARDSVATGSFLSNGLDFVMN